MSDLPGWKLGFASTALASALGCASPGVPKPPSLQLPERATGFKAQRVGNRVELSWQGSADTTDGAKLKGTVTASICRIVRPAKACAVVLQVPETSGENHAVEPLPQAELAGPPRLLLYYVELRNAHGRSAGPSAAAYSVAGAAPSMPADFAATPRRGGIELVWRAAPQAGTVVEVERTSRPASRPGRPQQEDTLDTVLLAGPPAGTPDPGGILDRRVKEGVPYHYVARRVQRVELEGRSVSLNSESTPVVSTTYLDVFAPAAPTGLVTIPGGGFGKPLFIDLSWQAGPEHDLAAYRVYRSTDGGALEPVTAKPVEATSYRDEHVSAGHRYLYRVTALGAHGTESEQSKSAEETLR